MNKKYHFQLTSPKNRRGYLVFSLPQTNRYQTISDLSIQPSNYKLSKDNKENRVAIFRLNDVIKTVRLQFTTSPRVKRVHLDPNSSIKDYSNVFKSNRFINGRDKKISQITRDIVKKEENLSKIVQSLYGFTLNYLTYGKPIEGLYTYKQAMEERITDCGGFSTFLASLLQSLNIPSRLVVGFLIKENLFSKILSRFEFCALSFEFLTMHAWLEVLLPDGSWFPLDPSKDLFGYIPADRLVTSYGEDFDLRIDDKIYQIDLLQKPVYL